MHIKSELEEQNYVISVTLNSEGENSILHPKGGVDWIGCVVTYIGAQTVAESTL